MACRLTSLHYWGKHYKSAKMPGHHKNYSFFIFVYLSLFFSFIFFFLPYCLFVFLFGHHSKNYGGFNKVKNGPTKFTNVPKRGQSWWVVSEINSYSFASCSYLISIWPMQLFSIRIVIRLDSAVHLSTHHFSQPFDHMWSEIMGHTWYLSHAKNDWTQKSVTFVCFS